MLHRYKIADVVFEADFVYAYSAHLYQKYVYSGQSPSKLHIGFSQKQIELEGVKNPNIPLPQLENLMVARAFSEYVLNNEDGIIFHCSAIAVDGKAYLFTAPSGTGKSTHAKLWRELLGERAVMVNDDKPIIRCVDGNFYVYGSPWNGKHSLDTNCRVKISGICHLQRGVDNQIKKVSPKDILPIILNQTIRPNKPESMDKLLNFISKMLNSVSLFELKCNTQLESAKISFNTMAEGNYED